MQPGESLKKRAKALGIGKTRLFAIRKAAGVSAAAK